MQRAMCTVYGTRRERLGFEAAVGTEEEALSQEEAGRRARGGLAWIELGQSDEAVARCSTLEEGGFGGDQRGET